MKLHIFREVPIDLPISGEWIFIQAALGDIEITFFKNDVSKSVIIGEGEQLRLAFDRLQFKAKATDHEISFRVGLGEYTPNITAVTSTVIDRIKTPISINGSLVVGSITTPVVVDSITTPVTVDSITNVVTVSEARRGSFLTNDLPIAANSFVDVAARDRSQIILQNMSESTTHCRVSNVSENTAAGMWLIGGGGLFGESPILKTNAALRVWNTSDSDALITITEVF